MIEGQLTISDGFSRLDGTRLMRGALNNGGFGRATSFLRQERNLQSGQQIRVDGVADEFQGEDVIVISDAGPAGQSLAPAGGMGLRAPGGSRATKSGAKKPAKKSAKKKRTAKSSSKKK